MVPATITRLPHGVGSAQSGRVKASEWHLLFAIYLPLTFLDLVFESTNFDEQYNQHKSFINNFFSLIKCTNIVSSKNISEKNCQNFKEQYKQYSETSTICYSNIQTLPNHHFALHIPDQLRWWGPLTLISKFPGERLIGILQKFKTNYSGMCS